MLSSKLNRMRSLRCLLVYFDMILILLSFLLSSVTIVVAYLMKKHGMGYSKAMELVRSRRSQAWPNLGFVSQLQQFEKSIQGR